MMTLSQKDPEKLDFPLLILLGLAPITRPSELGAEVKRDVRRLGRQQYCQRLKRMPGRMAALTFELDNIFQTAMKHGYNPSWLTTGRRQQF